MSVDYGGSGGDGDNVDNPYDDDGDSSGGGGDGGGSSLTWGVIAPDFLTENGGILRAFLNNPRGFVVGAVLTTLLETVTGVVTTLFDQLIRAVGGSQPTEFNAPGETLGLADVPVAIADTLIGAGGFSGDVIISAIEGFNEQIATAAAAVGPFGPLVLIILISAEAIIAVLILRRIVFVVADLLQLGGLTE